MPPSSVRRLLVWALVISIWAALLVLVVIWDGREVAVPTIVSPDVQTAIPDGGLQPVPLPRSTLPQRWPDSIKP